MILVLKNYSFDESQVKVADFEKEKPFQLCKNILNLLFCMKNFTFVLIKKQTIKGRLHCGISFYKLFVIKLNYYL